MRSLLKDIISLLGVFSFAFLMVAWAMSAKADTSKPSIVEIIEITGVINDGVPSALARAVETINENQRAKVVLLVMNSPGGGAVASASAYEELGKLKVPVVAWCDHVCASGGMYILMSPVVKFVGVRSETIAGSIGVIATVTRFNRLLEWLKIDNETYVSGALKDASNPTRAVRDDERKYIQAIISGLAERFYGVVEKSRKVTDWGAVKTGRIFSGSEAVKVGLADAVMTREEAVKKAKELSKVQTIFTREEMKKMSRAADDQAVYAVPGVRPQTQYGDIAWLIETLKEIRAGDVVSFSYVMPYKF